MGYDVHITRAEDWARNKGYEITTSEWGNLVQADAKLVPDPENGPNSVIWSGHPQGKKDAWIDWSMGNIYTTNPDRALVRKMLQIAKDLEAWVQGDDKEVYDSAEDYAK